MKMRRSAIQTLTLNAAAGTGFFFAASPAQAINFSTDFGSLFELYRPIRTHFRFIPSTTTNDLVNLTPLDFQPMLLQKSITVATAPASSGEMYQAQTLIVKEMMHPWTVTVVPSLAVALNSGNAYPPASQSWISIGSSPQMNGLRLWIDNCGNAGATSIGSVIYTFEFELMMAV